MILCWVFPCGRWRKAVQRVSAKAGTQPHTLSLCALLVPQLPCWQLMWEMLDMQPGLWSVLAAHRCHEWQKSRNPSREQCTYVRPLFGEHSLWVLLQHLPVKVCAESSVCYNPGRRKSHFPICTGSMVVSAVTKGLFSWAALFCRVVHAQCSEHCSHKKPVFLSAVAMGSSYAGSRFMNKKFVRFLWAPCCDCEGFLLFLCHGVQRDCGGVPL